MASVLRASASPCLFCRTLGISHDRTLSRIGKKANRPEIIRSLKEAADAADTRVRDAAKEALRKIQG